MRYLVLLSLQLISISVFGQAWTKAKGKSFTKIDYSTIQSVKQFNDAGIIVDADKLSNNSINFYTEYGLTNRLTIVAHLPYVSNALDNVSNSGIGDTDIALRYALKTSGLALSTTFQAGLPIGKNTDVNGLFTGDGEFNQMIKLNAGTGSNKWWTQLGVGFNNRTKGYSDEIRFDAELGYKLFSEKLLTILKIGSITSRNNGSINSLSKRGLYANNVEYFAPALELLYYFNQNYGLSVRAAGAGKGARNVQASPQFSIGFFADFK
jgi:hypothetical protein